METLDAYCGVYSIGTAARSLQLRSGGEPPNRLGMLSSLDHTIWYYDHDFDCSDWLLHVVCSSPVQSFYTPVLSVSALVSLYCV